MSRFMVSTLVDLLELFIAGMVTSKVGKRFAFKGLKALSEIFIRHVLTTLYSSTVFVNLMAFIIISVLHCSSLVK